MKSLFSIDLRPCNGNPIIRNGKSATSADTVEKFISVRAARYGCIIEWPNVNTKLTGIGERSGVASGEKTEHASVSRIRYIVRAVSGGNDQLRTSTYAKQTSWFSKQANIESKTRIGECIGGGTQTD